MKILHTSDWHLGKRLDRFSRHEEQQEVLDEICDIAGREQVDAVIIAGDLFDSYNPPTESEELFYRTLKRLSDDGRRPVIAIAGNHDSPYQIEAPDPLALENGIFLAGFPLSTFRPVHLESGLQVTRTAPGFVEFLLPGSKERLLRVLYTPYANEIRLRTWLGEKDKEGGLHTLLAGHWKALAEEYCDPQGVNILTTHLYMYADKGDNKTEELPGEPEEERPILHAGGTQALPASLLPPEIQYAALGHLHRYIPLTGSNVPAAYCGSPLPYSFDAGDQKKQVVIVEASPGEQARYHTLPLTRGRRLHQVRFEKVEEAVRWLEGHPDTFVELTMATDDYLTSTERETLLNAHRGIVSIIPEVKNMAGTGTEEHAVIDLSAGMEELFRQFFTAKNNGQAPNEEIMELFREILAK